MRVLWLVLGIVLLSTIAHARRLVIMEPTIAMRCPRAPTWEAMDKCVRNFGRPTTLKDQPDLKILAVASPSTPSYGLGIFLFLRKDKAWILGGMQEGDRLDLLSAAPITLNRHAGYRLEIGQTLRTSVMQDDGTATPGIVRYLRTLYCSGDNYNCTQVISLCEVFVGGKVTQLFRGTISVKDQNLLEVDGDRSRAGTSCRVGERAYLGWSPNTP